MPTSTTDIATPADVTDAQLTFYDDGTGERTALSAGALRTWVRRTANLLRHGYGLGVGAKAVVLLPPHWQTAAVLLGCWSAGISVEFRGATTAGLSHPDTAPDVVFAAAHRVGNWIDEIPPAPHRLALGGTAVGYLNFLDELDRYEARHQVDGEVLAVRHGAADPATVDGTTYAEWVKVATTMAGALDLRPGDRVLVDASTREEPLKWLLAPLAVGASIVICANLDPARLPERLAAERITRQL
jgi:uncharacterized protein (TIGR03089 family)